MAIDLGCHVGCASPETKQEETADPTAAPVVVDDVEAAAGGRRPGDGGGVNYVARAQWLRAAVLGANDGLVSVASLMCDIQAAQIERARGGKDADGGEEEEELPSPTMAAVASALSFAAGAALPLLAGGFVRPWAARVAAVCAASSLGLAGFGVASAYLGGAGVARSGVRMLVGGWLAMAVTYGVLKLFGMHGV
uniref:Vacuolar iron transporter n=1 Tax=Oryza barthii TaxID=65489 RepID=A0A0D3F860_9ORYZ